MSYGIYSGGSVIAQFAAPMTVRSNRPIFASDALSLSRSAVARTAQRWEIETQFVPLSHGANRLMAVLVASGHETPLTIITPQNWGAVQARTATGGATASGSQGASSVSVSVSGLIPAGTFVKFGGSTKVHLTLADRSGSGTVAIFPQLPVAVSGTMNYLDDVIMTCYLDLDTIVGMSYSDGILMDLGTVKLVEKV